jgi:hypothetical protein
MNHFVTNDFEGRQIICEESQWVDHVCKKPHSYMEGAEAEVIDALQNPDFGLRHVDREYPFYRIYYKISTTKDYFTRVVVEFGNEDGEGPGRVVTAFQPDSIRHGDQPEFRRK